MKKKILSIIALMLVMVMAFTSCALVNKTIDFIKDLISPSVALSDSALVTEKIIDFKDGADPNVLFESEGWSNGDVFNVVWQGHNVHYENGIMRLGITEESASAWLDGKDVPFNYTAGEARTQNYYHYGDYEVSMKPSANPGTASTFFICTGPYDLKDGNPNPHDEIDIEFLGNDTTHVQFNFFVDGKGGNEYMYDLGFDASEAFHTYGFRWTENSITWFVDGAPVYKVTTDTSVEEAGNLKIVEKLPSTAGRILANYWCGNERAWGWMGKYIGETKDNGTQYQWMATSAEGAPLNPPVVNPPVGGDDTDTDNDIDWSAISAIVPAFPDAAPYVVAVDDTKADVTYTDVSGSAYMPIELDVTNEVAGKNYVHLKVTNNGSEAVNVRVNMFDPTLTGNNKATNISATMNGVAVRTDLEWGGSFFDIAAGESAELVVYFGVGGIKLQLMIDSSRNDSVLRSGNVTIEELKFAAVGEVEIPHKCEDIDENGKCDGCGEDMPLPPAPVPEDPTSGNLNTTINDTEITFNGNVTDGYGVNAENGVLSVEYTNIVGNSYKNFWATVSSIAATADTFTMKVTNNGTAAVKVRIDIESQTQVTSNTTCCNFSATQDGVEVYTDLEWGGSTFVIEAGATAVLEVVYDASKAPTNVKIFVDSCQWDDSTVHSGSITISEMAFSGEYAPVDPDPTPDPTPDPEPDVDTGLQFEFWASSDSYVTNGNNIQYNGAGNAYSCVGTDISALAAGKNTFTVTITNNGAADSRVRVDIQATNQVGNHTVVNTGATGGDVWTDFEWGGSTVTVAAGQSVTLVVTYDEHTDRGAVTNLVVFVDAARGDDAIYSSDITLSGMAFSGESVPVDPDPTPDHSCEDVCPECGKCTDAACEDAACADKCQGHYVFETGEYLQYAGNDCYAFDGESYLETINFTYANVSTNTYQNVNTWIKDKAEGHTTLKLYIVNNGDATVYVTVKLEAGGAGLAETKAYVGAGQVEEISLDFAGAPELLYFFIDTGWSESTTSHAGNVTVRGVRFVGEVGDSDEEVFVPVTGEYLNYKGNDCYTFDNESYLESINITYTAVNTNTWQNINTWVQDKAAGKSILKLYIKNNGEDVVNVTVKLEVAGAGVGETKVQVQAGEMIEVELEYAGAADLIFFFIDSDWTEVTTTHAGDITISGVRFE